MTNFEEVVEHSIRFNGRKYCLKDNGYYYNCTTRKHLHQAIWEFYNGPIPKGYQIHHKDGNRLNNDISNLDCLPPKEHAKFHKEHMTEEQREQRRLNLEKNARPKAIEWHKSEEGRKWHSEHAKRLFAEDKTCKRIILRCSYCDKEYIGVNNNTIGNHFCSNKCKAAYRRKMGYDNVERVCEICGKTFTTSKFSKCTTCSGSCSNKLRWQHRKEK